MRRAVRKTVDDTGQSVGVFIEVHVFVLFYRDISPGTQTGRCSCACQVKMTREARVHWPLMAGFCAVVRRIPQFLC